MKRAECLRQLAALTRDDDLVVAALGGTWDEWHQVRPSDANFFNSAMGTNVPLAMGLAIALPQRRIVLLDTDGCVLMTMGALCTLGDLRPPNLRVFVFDNAAYLATGGQPTPTGRRADLSAIARGAGIEEAVTLSTEPAYTGYINEAMMGHSFSFAVVKVESVASPRTIRRENHVENKYRFVRYVERTENVDIISH
jgi:thiamine pyrophosphate-dependent acetolactate synthase large subunit-like protein